MIGLVLADYILFGGQDGWLFRDSPANATECFQVDIGALELWEHADIWVDGNIL